MATCSNRGKVIKVYVSPHFLHFTVNVDERLQLTLALRRLTAQINPLLTRWQWGKVRKRCTSVTVRSHHALWRACTLSPQGKTHISGMWGHIDLYGIKLRCFLRWGSKTVCKNVVIRWYSALISLKFHHIICMNFTKTPNPNLSLFGVSDVK